MLALLHNRASIARGFVVSKSMLVENMATDSQVAQRIVFQPHENE